jgi:GntR family galactonate operon transcriptional repressor
MVAVGSAGWFEDNLPNHAAAARAIDEGNARKARAAMEQVLSYTQIKLSKRGAAKARKPVAKAKGKRNGS